MEIGRFIYGGFQMPDKALHIHSELAYKMFEDHTVGEINENFENLIFRPIREPPKEKLANQSWKIVSKKMISSVHGVFQFSNPNYKIAGVLPYFDHCGKYYTVLVFKYP